MSMAPEQQEAILHYRRSMDNREDQVYSRHHPATATADAGGHLFMSTTRSDRIYELWFDADCKFEYYLTGLTFTVIAYWGKGLKTPHAILSPETATALGLSLLLVSAIFGLRRMERSIQVVRLNSRALYLSEKAAGYESASARPGLSKDMVSGIVVSPHEASQRASQIRNKSYALDKAIEKLTPQGKYLYRWRNRTLIVGLTLTLASHLWTRG
ncbi:MAG: hypothetical protein IPM94_11485 [bacterium]|nr:hypothetical protein [bacterium]